MSMWSLTEGILLLQKEQLKYIANEQTGCMPAKGSREQLLTTTEKTAEKCYEFNTPVVLCFRDYTKSFNMIV